MRSLLTVKEYLVENPETKHPKISKNRIDQGPEKIVPSFLEAIAFEAYKHLE